MTKPAKDLKVFTPYILAAVLLLWALVPSNPYGYYSVMRWILCATFIYIAVKSHEQQRQVWIWVWGVLAGIYNPIVPVRATREFWEIINIVTIVIVIVGVIRFRSREL